MKQSYPLKLLAAAIVAGSLLGTSGCMAGRNHELTKTTTTYAPSGDVESVEEMSFESGITFVNAKADLSEIEFNESLGKEGEVWQSTGSADSAKTSPEDRVFRTIENSFALYRNIPIPDPGRSDLDDRLSRIEAAILSDQAKPRPVEGPPNEETLTPSDRTLLRYLRGLRDSPTDPAGSD